MTVKNHYRKHLYALIVFSLLSLLLSGCSFSSPEKTAEKYFSAVKAGDAEKAIQCFIPSVRAQYELGFKISDRLFGGVLGNNSESIWNALLGTTNYEYYKDYDFETSWTDYSDSTHATVYVDVYVNGALKKTTQVRCTEIDGDWYIEQ